MGFQELLLLGAIAIIFIGPRQLPEVARTLARFINELKRASSEVSSDFRKIQTEVQTPNTIITETQPSDNNPDTPSNT